MNCKPGDLARVVSHPDTRKAGIVNKIVKVKVCDGVTKSGHAGWSLYPPNLFAFGGGARIDFIADFLLMPIRDPGDDAIDEMVLIAGKPERVAA